MRRSRSGEDRAGGEAEGKASHRPRGGDEVGASGEEIKASVAGEWRAKGSGREDAGWSALVQGQERGLIQRREGI